MSLLVEQFVDPPPPHFVCNICGLVPLDPCKCLYCQGVNCRLCLAKYLSQREYSLCPYATSNNCPVTDLSKAALAVNSSIMGRHHLSLLRVWCQFAHNGCPTKPIVRDYEKHVNFECEYHPRKLINCKNCGLYVLPIRLVNRQHICIKDALTGLDSDLQVAGSDRTPTFKVREPTVAEMVSSVTRFDNSEAANHFELDGSKQVTNMHRLIYDLQQMIGMTNRLTAAFLSVDRAKYVPSDQLHLAYVDTPVHRLGSLTWSVGAVNLVEPVLTDGCRILVMSSYPGYEVAVLSQLVGAKGYVVAQNLNWIETIKERIKYKVDVPTKLSRIHSAVVRVDEPCNFYAPYNAIIDRLQRPRGLSRNVYFHLLAPLGIAIYFTTEQRWTVFRKSADCMRIEEFWKR